MRLSRPAAFTVAGAVLSGLVAAGAAAAQTAAGLPSQTAAETAKAVARTIAETAPKATSGAITFQSATAHENVVEVQFVLTDAALLPRAKQLVERQRLSVAHSFCDEGRSPLLNSGIVIHQVITAPDDSHLGFTVDRSTCATLTAAPAPAAPKTAAETASAIARTIEESTPKAPNPVMTFISATAHDNVVEVRFAVQNPEMFARAKANTEMQRTAMAHIYCHDDPAAPLNQGVVIHQVIAGPDGHDQIEFTIDRAACAALAPPPKLADAKTLSALAQTVAQDVNADKKSLVPKSSRKMKSPFRFDTAEAHDGVVEVHFIATDAVAGQGMKGNQPTINGIFRGYFCAKYGDQIRQGVSMRPEFTLDDGTALFDFTIDRKACGA